MDALGTDTGVGWLTAGFESALLPWKIIRTFSGWNVLLPSDEDGADTGFYYAR